MGRKSSIGIDGAGRTEITNNAGEPAWRYWVRDDMGHSQTREIAKGAEKAGLAWVQERQREFGLGGSALKADLVPMAVAFHKAKLDIGKRRQNPKSVAHYGHILLVAKVVARDVGRDVKHHDFGPRFQEWLSNLKPGWHLAPGAAPHKFASKTKKELAPGYLGKLRTHISTIIEWAAKRPRYGIVRNPLGMIELPEAQTRIKPIFTAAELRTMLAAESSSWFVPCAIMAYTGARPDEAMHLRWPDVLWDAKKIKLGITVTEAGERGKTATERLVDLQPELAEILMDVGPSTAGYVIRDDLMRQRGVEKRRRGKKGKDSTVKYSDGFKRFLADLAIPKGRRSTYSFRHSFVAHQLAIPGYSIGDLQMSLGHADMKLTLKTYGSAREQCKQSVKGWPPGIFCLRHAPDSAFHVPEKKSEQKQASGIAEIVRQAAEIKRLERLVDLLMAGKEPVVIEGLGPIPGPGSAVG